MRTFFYISPLFRQCYCHKQQFFFSILFKFIPTFFPPQFRQWHCHKLCTFFFFFFLFTALQNKKILILLYVLLFFVFVYTSIIFFFYKNLCTFFISVYSVHFKIRINVLNLSLSVQNLRTFFLFLFTSLYNKNIALEFTACKLE